MPLLAKVLLFVLMAAGVGTSFAATFVYFGTNFVDPDAGIFVSELDPENGVLSAPRRVARMNQAAFLALHPDGRHLYSVGERDVGILRAFAIDAATGSLAEINDQSSRGAGPCHISLDRAGRHAFVANYSAGSASVSAINLDGSLGDSTACMIYGGSGPNAARQERPHAHSANLDPSQQFLIVADLGTDRLMVHRFRARDGSLEDNDPPFVTLAPGSGPRHFAFHPDGVHAYVVNELLSTVTAFDWDPAGGILTARQTVNTLPAGFATKNTTAEIVVHPGGRFLYVSNRGHDSIAIFAVDPATGLLRAIGHQPSGGKTPRNFAASPDGRWLIVANQASDNAVVLAVDSGNGTLKPTGSLVTVPTPTCVRFLVID